MSIPINDLLTAVNNDLKGYANAFSQSQKLEALNKAKDEVCSILKTQNANYFVTSSQSSDSTAAHYFAALNTTTREYTLPPDMLELRFIEVTSPAGYEGTDFQFRDLSHPDFQNSRRIATANGSATPAIAGSSIYFYTITGKDQFMLADYPETAFVIKLWYVYAIPDFASDDTLSEILFPYDKKLSDWAVKRLLLQEQDQAGYAAWTTEWRTSVITLTGASNVRQSTTPEFVADFVED